MIHFGQVCCLTDMSKISTRPFSPSVVVQINSSRWAAYAAAGAATAMACVSSAEADIHYVSVNEHFSAPPPAPNFITDQFQLVPGAYLNFLHATGPNGGGVAGFYFGTSGAVSAKFVGVSGTFNGMPYHYVGKLSFGESITNQAFVGNVPGHYNPLASGSGYPNSQWAEEGTGFMAFKFDLGKGVQYRLGANPHGWSAVEQFYPHRLRLYRSG